MPRLPIRLTTAQIGRAGELLVQYRLLLLGIESAPMSTDAGIDLVAYSSAVIKPTTIQVKTNLKPKPAGGKGKASLDWRMPDDSPSELHALVDLLEQRVWLFKHTEISKLAQQHSGGKYHLYMYTDPTHEAKKLNRATHAYEYQRYLLENRARSIFGV